MRYAPVEPILGDCVTDAFDCGSDVQSNWLRRHALQAHRSDTAHVQVVTLAGTRQVVAYHALAAGSVEHATVPGRVAKGVPRHPVPVVVLTRLGVDRAEQGRGLGRALVKDALRRVAAAADIIGARAMLIHCETPAARQFYLRLADFEASPTDPLHLYLLLGDLRRTLAREPDAAGA